MNKLYHGKCEEILKSIPDNSVDLCLTDLPYGTMKPSEKECIEYRDTIKRCCWDNLVDFDVVIPELYRIMKKNSMVVLFAKAPFTYRLFDEVTKKFEWKYNWIWDKGIYANFRSS